ncbi:hypothetical protein OG21DRAFT_567120 [Imleria badia]|nr:hypothetical protein OG21DRAFT_567120 [Imleria badia]
MDNRANARGSERQHQSFTVIAIQAHQPHLRSVACGVRRGKTIHALWCRSSCQDACTQGTMAAGRTIGGSMGCAYNVTRGGTVHRVRVIGIAQESSRKWKLLEFQLKDDSGGVYDSNDIDPPAWASSSPSRVELDGGKSRFLFIPTEDPEGVVFDTRTRTFYAVPPMRVAQPGTFPEQFHSPIRVVFRMVFTDTDMIALTHFRTLFESVTLVQSFAIPSDGSLDREGKPTLCLIFSRSGS